MRAARHSSWDGSTVNDLRESVERKGSFKPGSQILQCGIVQAIKGIFRTACVIAELLQCIKRLPCRKEGRQMGEDGGQAAGIIRSKAWEFQM
jgi:hypothetical protein